MVRRQRYAPVAAALLLAIAFALWELPFASFMADDFIQLAILEKVSPVPTLGAWELYTISDGNSEHIRQFKDAGAMPWFFDPAFKMAFFRPLSSLSLALDHRLFGLHPSGYHVHVALWFFLLVIACGAIHRQAFGAPVPGPATSTAIPTLAILLFTVAGANAILCWTATRHIAIAAALGTAALYTHLCWREGGWRPGRWISVVLLLAALSASEAGIALFAYIGAYEVLGARDHARRRAGALLPFLAVLMAYVVMYRRFGFGTSSGSDYLDPFGNPSAFLAQISGRVVFLLAAMVTGGNADLWVLRPDLRSLLIAIAAAVMLLFGVVLRAAWAAATADQRRGARWLTVGAGLSAVPFAASPIGARCLIVPWIGGSTAVALILNRWATTWRRPAASQRLLSTGCWALAVIHLVFAPLQRLVLPPLLQRMMAHDIATAMADPALPVAHGTSETWVILNAPDLRIGLHAYFFRRLYRLPMPATWRVLSWAPCTHRFRRQDIDSLDLELDGCALHAPHLAANQTIVTDRMRATVLETGRDGPTRVRFQFNSSLDDPSFAWLAWKQGALHRVALPRPGESVDLRAGEDL